MLAVQHRLPLAPPRVRSVRRSFRPAVSTDPYRLPHNIGDRLVAALTPFRNRDAAFALAVFLARFWSAPGRVSGSFPIDRRALADHVGLELSEARVRGAIRTLETIGFLDRALVSGSTYRPTEHGLRRRAILFVFGAEYAPAFVAANSRAAAAQGRRSADRRPSTYADGRRASTANFGAPLLKSPKNKSEAESLVFMGEITESALPPSRPESDLKLEAALERWSRGFRQRQS